MGFPPGLNIADTDAVDLFKDDNVAARLDELSRKSMGLGLLMNPCDVKCFRRYGPGNKFELLIQWQWSYIHSGELAGSVWGWVRYPNLLASNDIRSNVNMALDTLGWNIDDMQMRYLQSTPNLVYTVREVCQPAAPLPCLPAHQAPAHQAPAHQGMEWTTMLDDLPSELADYIAALPLDSEQGSTA